jgi:hypothetical protein
MEKSTNLIICFWLVFGQQAGFNPPAGPEDIMIDLVVFVTGWLKDLQ